MKKTFFGNLTRTHKQLTADRANLYAEGAQAEQKSLIEDIKSQIRVKKLKLSQLDDCSTGVFSSNMKKDFSSKEYITERHDLLLDLRNLKIELEIAEDELSFFALEEL